MFDDEIIDDTQPPPANEDIVSNNEDVASNAEDVASNIDDLKAFDADNFPLSDVSVETTPDEQAIISLDVLDESSLDSISLASMSLDSISMADPHSKENFISDMDDLLSGDAIFNAEEVPVTDSPAFVDVSANVEGLLLTDVPSADTNLLDDNLFVQVDAPEVLESISFSDSDLDSLLFSDSDASFGAAGDELRISDILGSGPSNLEKGLETLLKKTAIYYEHLPMLEVVFDHLTRLLSTSLRNFTSENIELSIESIKSKRLGDYLNSIQLPAMFSVFKAEEWDNQGLIVVDNTIIYSIVDALLGGRHNNEYDNTDLRLYTTIEHNLMAKFIAVVLQDCAQAFLSVSYVNFVYERIEYNPHFAMISRPTSPGIVLTIKFEIEEHFGKFSLFFPYATLEPIRELLMQNFMGEKFGRDSIWEQHLVNELKETDVKLDAILLSEMRCLSELFKWKVGDTVMFNAHAETKVKIFTGTCPLFLGMVGHKNGHVAIRIDESYINENGVNLESGR